MLVNFVNKANFAMTRVSTITRVSVIKLVNVDLPGALTTTVLKASERSYACQINFTKKKKYLKLKNLLMKKKIKIKK